MKVSNNLIFVLYIIAIIGSGVGIGYFLKSIKIEIKLLQLQVEDLKQRITRIENKIMKM